MRSGFLTIAVFFTLFKPVYAGVDTLTEDNLKSFYKDYISIQTGSPDNAIAFLKKHIHEDFKMTVNVITKMEGAPSQKQVLDFNKEELLQETRKGMEVGKTVSVDHNIISMKISDDGKSARVKDSSFSIIRLSIGNEQMPAKFVDEQSMLCDATLVVGESGLIVIKESVCNSEDYIKPVE